MPSKVFCEKVRKEIPPCPNNCGARTLFDCIVNTREVHRAKLAENPYPLFPQRRKQGRDNSDAWGYLVILAMMFLTLFVAISFVFFLVRWELFVKP